MDRQPVLGRSLDQRITKELKIRIGRKYRLPIIATLDDLLRLSGYDETGKTGHGKKTPQSGTFSSQDQYRV